jgi:hypothetical protein
VTDEILAGVISIPHGWGHARPGIRLGTASAHPGVSINDLTDAARVDAVSGNAAFSAVPVSVTAGRASLDASTNGDLLAHEIPGNQ